MTVMEKLYREVAADSELRAKFNAIMGDAEKSGEAATGEKLVAFAKEAGYKVSYDEIKSFFKEMAEKIEGEMTDAELDSVAGGKGGVSTLVSVLGLGFGCGILSALGEAALGGCTETMKKDF